MKKNYMTPDIELITMSAGNILAGSIEILIDNEEYNGTFHSPELVLSEEEILFTE